MNRAGSKITRSRLKDLKSRLKSRNILARFAAEGLYFWNFAKIIAEAKIGLRLDYFKTTSYFWCIVPLIARLERS